MEDHPKSGLSTSGTNVSDTDMKNSLNSILKSKQFSTEFKGFNIYSLGLRSDKPQSSPNIQVNFRDLIILVKNCLRHY